MALIPAQMRMTHGMTYGQRDRLSAYYNVAQSAYKYGKRAYDWYSNNDSPPRKKYKIDHRSKMRPMHQTIARTGPNAGRMTKYGTPASQRYLSGVRYMRKRFRGRRRKKYRRYYKK